MLSDLVLCVIRASPAGLKWIASMPGGSAVTALPSDIAIGLVPRFSVNAARASPCASSASAAAASARECCDITAPRSSEMQRHVHAEGEVRRVGGEADA